MRVAFMIALSLVLCSTSGVSAQASTVGAAPPGNLDPAFAALLFTTSEPTAMGVTMAPLSVSEAQARRKDALVAYRSRVLIGTGIGITVGSVLGALAFARPSYCPGQERPRNTTAPRVTSAVVGTVGMTLVVSGMLRLIWLPKEARERARLSVGRSLAIAGAALGLSVLSSIAVGVSTAPEIVRCGTT